MPTAVPGSTSPVPVRDAAGDTTSDGSTTYAYDAFNRLTGSNKNSGAVVYAYKYDRFGNRWNQTVTAGSGANSSLGFGANNRIVSGSGVAYDAAGDTTSDGSTTYTYDAEGRIKTAVNASSGTSTYVYDAEGRRVRKTTVAGGTVDFLYDLAGHQIVQIGSTGTWTRGEVYAGGRHLATYSGGTGGTTYFIHADWLGTERARSTVTGSPYETCMSLPFGDWLTCSGGDPSPMHFTGKEHDTETGNDHFEARDFSSSSGRWVRPDPINLTSARLVNPGNTLNKYAYAANNPLKYIDPTGMQEVTAAQCALDPRCVTINVNVIYDKNSNGGKGLTDKQKAAFEKGQLQDAKDEYGNADIHLNVTYTAGALTVGDNGKAQVSGAQAGALNVVVTDQVTSGRSTTNKGIAYSFVNPNSDDLPHEMAHQFMGDTQGWRNFVMTKDQTMIGAMTLNAITDIGNDFERAWMRTLDSHSGPFSHYPLASAFNRNAEIFQKRIQPTTKPQ